MSPGRDVLSPRWYARILHVMLWGAGLVLAGLFLAGVAGWFVSPDQYWVLQLLGIFVPYLAGSLLLTSGLAALRRRWALVGLLGLVTATGLLAPMIARDRMKPEAPPDDAPGLTVMSFNAGTDKPGSKQDDLAALVARERPHLIAMQELPVRLHASTGITSGPPLIIPLVQGRAYSIAWPESGRDVLLDLSTFSRVESAGPATVPVGDRKKGLWASGGVVRSVYRWQGDSIAVYNVHLHSFDAARPWEEGWRRVFSPRAWRTALAAYREDFRVRAVQARRLRALLDAEPLPFILCGDLNSTPSNWVYAHLSRGLRDAFRESGRGWGNTYPAQRPLVRIDFILVSPEWTVRRAKVDDTLSSDHRPVLAELVLRPSGASPETPR